ncbi:RNA polymerase sigma factor [Massilia sp. G4R7]|uniref:RNA polymerase sigma factor n=1 Tax=Massilia phyllostachyos TaxID=2898585 RepID=A0ABS8Q621_9BURK|nr:RNA polymerase sigma factor [Massilia phyllostachyos]MCD2517189.1 RNA polymerase sigma factor [Massilia phyllostachyos]
MTTMTTTEPLDTELLQRMHAGRADAFTALYRRHQGPLFRYALMRCGSSDTAADVVQEAFMGLLTGRLHFDPLRGQLQHFLFGVARKLILKVEEGRGRHVALPDPGEDDGEGVERDLPCEGAEPLARLLGNETAEEVRRALAQLAPHYRDVVILFELHELSYLEIAAICQVDIGTVRSRLSRGRAALARRLQAHAPAARPPCLTH